MKKPMLAPMITLFLIIPALTSCVSLLTPAAFGHTSQPLPLLSLKETAETTKTETYLTGSIGFSDPMKALRQNESKEYSFDTDIQGNLGLGVINAFTSSELVTTNLGLFAAGFCNYGQRFAGLLSFQGFAYGFTGRFNATVIAGEKTMAKFLWQHDIIYNFERGDWWTTRNEWSNTAHVDKNYAYDDVYNTAPSGQTIAYEQTIGANIPLHDETWLNGGIGLGLLADDLVRLFQYTFGLDNNTSMTQIYMKAQLQYQTRDVCFWLASTIEQPSFIYFFLGAIPTVKSTLSAGISLKVADW